GCEQGAVLCVEGLIGNRGRRCVALERLREGDLLRDDRFVPRGRRAKCGARSEGQGEGRAASHELGHGDPAAARRFRLQILLWTGIPPRTRGVRACSLRVGASELPAYAADAAREPARAGAGGSAAPPAPPPARLLRTASRGGGGLGVPPLAG